MTDLTALIVRVEAATGPDGRLCAEIDCAVRFPDLRPAEPDDFGGKYGYQAHSIKVEHGFLQARQYMSSADDALTLVPDGAGLKIERYWLRRPEPAWRATIYTGGVPSDPARQFTAEDCYTAGAAITAAALKARAAQESPQ